MSNKINLNTFAGGALAEQFNNEFQKIMENIDDPNTPAVSARKITIDITIKPNQRRNGANITVNAKSKMAPVVPIETSMNIYKDNDGHVIGAEIARPGQVAGQIEMDLTEIDTPAGGPGVIDLQKRNKSQEVVQ